ncbi:MAG: tRNA pseudouridine(13) synthase TruD, partial [Thermoproteota archaeon]|nr:tRNA pseudouridine(13) synthase TruD [Thermoproteota archaeon]
MASIPQIDILAGIECYCANFVGIGGSIKHGSEGFVVFELLDESLDISMSYDESHRYPLYILQKQDIDSNHALFEIERELHIKLRVMGIKDAKAITTQCAGMERIMRNPPKKIRSRHTQLTLKGFTKHPLE